MTSLPALERAYHAAYAAFVADPASIPLEAAAIATFCEWIRDGSLPPAVVNALISTRIRLCQRMARRAAERASR